MGVRRKETIPRDLREGVAPCIGNRILEPEIFGCGIRNPGLWNSEYSLRNLESH